MLRNICGRRHVQFARNSLLGRESCFIFNSRFYQERKLTSPRRTKTRITGIDKGIEGTKKVPKVKDSDVEFLKLWKSTEKNYRTQLRGTMMEKRVSKKQVKELNMGAVPRQSELTKEASLVMEDNDFGFRVPRFREIVSKLNLGRPVNKIPSFKEEKEKKEMTQVMDNVTCDVSFEDIGVHPKLIKKLQKYSITRPVLIQERALPLIYDSQSILIKSETGSGKTLVFLLPTLQDPGKSYGTVIVVPTRELASQMLYEAHRLLGDKSIMASFVSSCFTKLVLYMNYMNRKKLTFLVE